MSDKKIEIPQEVADAIEAFRISEYSDYGIVTNLDNSEIAARKGLDKELKTLRDWIYDKPYDNPDKFLELLVNGYEVVPEYKVGDWVTYDNGPTTGDVTSLVLSIDDVGFLHFGEGLCMHLDDVRHATPKEIKSEKERQLWEKIDEGDVLINTATEELGIFFKQKAGYAVIKQRKGESYIDHWNPMNIELYAKKVGDSDD